MFGIFASKSQAQVILGDAPKAPTSLSGLPGGGFHANVTIAGGFSVDTSSREQVRQFYNAVYTSSTGLPINSTAVVSSCIPGTNSPIFVNAVLRRINWFRAMAGIPASITFDAAECTKNQAAALMMAEHGALQHVGVWTGWNCLSSDGTNASGNSNLALGVYGADAITGYILDNGANNYEVGHRRWILYPQTQIMGTGDVPPQGAYYSANATWVFDAHYGGPRPATRTPYCAWPPAGFVPYQVVYPQWSFALSNANLSGATVTLTSNGVPVAVSKQSYLTGYGENTLVFYPTSLDPANGTTFPFNGTDTVYTVTVSNVVTSTGTKAYSYNVTLFNPAVAGADYVPLVISGPNQPTANAGNLYSCTISSNISVTGYQWLTSQTTNGDFVDNALNGLTNFTISPLSGYPIITNPAVGTGKCFHLAHPTGVSQFLQLKETLFPSNSTALKFKSMLANATSAQTARVQASADGGSTWQDIYTQAGSGTGETSFTQKTISLANYAGKNTLLRFNYDFVSGSYYPQSSPNVGWSIENIIVTNSQQLLSQVTNNTASTNFTFTPPSTGNYLLQARAIIFTEFPTDFGVAKSVTAVAGPMVLMASAPVVNGNQVTIGFTCSGPAPSFHLLQTHQLGSPWTTNATAVLATNIPGSTYQFTTTGTPSGRLYRVVTP